MVQDGHDLVAWLLTQDGIYDQHREHVAAALYTRCRALQLEPPTPDRVDRLVRSAMHAAEERLCATILSRLSVPVLVELDLLVNPSPAEAVPAIVEDVVPLHALKTDPGRVSLESVLSTVAKLQRLRRLGLPADLFHDVPPKLVTAYRNRAAAEPPRELRAHDLIGLAQLLGHTSVDTTRIYVKRTEEGLAARVDRIDLNAYGR